MWFLRSLVRNEAHGQTVEQRIGEEVVGAWVPRAPKRASPDTPETHQSAMAPYFAVAAAAFELNSVAAVFRFALSAKVCPVQAGGGEGGGGGEGDGGGDALAVINIVFLPTLEP